MLEEYAKSILQMAADTKEMKAKLSQLDEVKELVSLSKSEYTQLSKSVAKDLSDLEDEFIDFEKKLDGLNIVLIKNNAKSEKDMEVVLGRVNKINTELWKELKTTKEKIAYIEKNVQTESELMKGSVKKVVEDVIDSMSSRIVAIRESIKGIDIESLSRKLEEMEEKLKNFNPQVHVQWLGSWVTRFTQLWDAPTSYEWQAGKVVKVNANEDGVEFWTATGAGIESVVWGTDITIDNTDPDNPIVNYTWAGGVSDWDKWDVTVSDSWATRTIDDGVVTETKLSTSVNASLDLADSSLQSGDNVSELTNDAGYTTNTGTVTSVAVSWSDGIEVDSWSPITTAWTIALWVNKIAMLSHLNVEDWADVTDATNVAAAWAFMKATDDTDDITEGVTNLFMNSTEQAKLGNISVTQAVDLDQMETDIAALANGMVYKGNRDASAWTFPWAWAAQAGRFYTVSVGGTVDSVVFAVDDRLVATTDNASATTYAWNWTKLDATDAVTTVFGRNGNVVATNGDYTASQITNVAAGNISAVTVQAAIDELDTEKQPVNSNLTTIAGLTATTDNFIVSVASAWASRTPSQVRTTLGLVIGTNVQAYDAWLASIAGLTTAADTMIYTTALDTYATTPLTSFARTLLDDTTAANAATTLWLWTSNSPQFTEVNVGHASDTTIARVSAWVLSIEGVTIATSSNTLTLTNKTIDANGTGNSITNLEVADFTAAAIVTAADTIATNDNDTTLPTCAAVIDYVAANAVFVGCKAYRTTDVSLTQNVRATIDLDNEDFDTDTFHDNATNPSRITIPTGQWGKYLIVASAEFTTNKTAGVRILIDGTTVPEGATQSAGNCGLGNEGRVVTFIMDLTQAQYVEVQAGTANTATSCLFASLTLTKIG